MDNTLAENDSTAAKTADIEVDKAATNAQNTDSAADNAPDSAVKTAETPNEGDSSPESGEKTADSKVDKPVATDNKPAQNDPKKPDSESKKPKTDPKKAASTTKVLDATKKVVDAALDLAKTSETATVGSTTTIKVLRSHPKLGAWPGAVTTIPAALAAELIAGEFAREASVDELAQVETSGYTETL